MSAWLKAVTVLVGATGAAGGIVASISGRENVVNLAFSENITSINSVTFTRDPNQELVEQLSKKTQLPDITKAGNCTAFEPSDESIFEDLGIVDIDSYTFVYCTNTNDEDSDWSQWTGLLPNSLFGLYYKLDAGTRFELRAIIESIDEFENKHKITLTSEKLVDSPAIGKWGSTFTISSGKEVTAVTFVSEKHQDEDKMYLLFDQTID